MAWNSDPQFKSWVTEGRVQSVKGTLDAPYVTWRWTLRTRVKIPSWNIQNQRSNSKILKRVKVLQLQCWHCGAELELNLVMLVTKMIAVWMILILHLIEVLQALQIQHLQDLVTVDLCLKGALSLRRGESETIYLKKKLYGQSQCQSNSLVEQTYDHTWQHHRGTVYFAF